MGHGMSCDIYRWHDAKDVGNLRYSSVHNSTIQQQYTRADENGVPFNVTVVSTSSVLIRERDTQEQIFVSVEEVAAVVEELCEGHITWADVLKKYPLRRSIQLPNMSEE
ncbi:glycyl-tRNA synthetase [Tanacetum coccineum]